MVPSNADKGKEHSLEAMSDNEEDAYDAFGAESVEDMDVGGDPSAFEGEADKGDEGEGRGVSDGLGLEDAAQAATDEGRKGKSKKDRITTPYMTKYERARVLGTRAMQISMNAPTLVAVENETDPLKIAEKELRERKLPIMIRRYLPDGSYEDWGIDELIIL